MGMWTEFSFGFHLKADTPKAVTDILQAMGDGTAEALEMRSEGHPFFETACWRVMLTSDTLSCRFPVMNLGFNRWNELALTVWTSIKNYDCEIEKFLDWIAPHIYCDEDTTEFIGWMRREDETAPTLAYLNEGRITQSQCPRRNNTRRSPRS